MDFCLWGLKTHNGTNKNGKNQITFLTIYIYLYPVAYRSLIKQLCVHLSLYKLCQSWLFSFKAFKWSMVYRANNKLFHNRMWFPLWDSLTGLQCKTVTNKCVLAARELDYNWVVCCSRNGLLGQCWCAFSRLMCGIHLLNKGEALRIFQ